MPRILRAAGAAALPAALVAALLAPTAAVADSWRVTDPRGDVAGWHYDPEPEPCGTSTVVDASDQGNVDITGLGVRHTRRAVVLTTRFRELDPDQGQMVDLAIRSSTGGWELDLYRDAPGDGGWQTYSSLNREPKYPDPDDLEECEGFGIVIDVTPCGIGRDVDFAKDLVRLSVPRSCLGNPRWVRVGVGTYDFIDDGGGSFTYFSDEWDGGTVVSPWLPPIGPRVRATRGATVGEERARPASEERRRYVVRDGRIFGRR